MAGLKNADDFASGERFNADPLKFLLLMVGVGATLLFFIIAAFQPDAKELKIEVPVAHHEVGEGVGAASGEGGESGESGESGDALPQQTETKIVTYNGKGAMGYSWLFGVVFFLTLTIGGIFFTLLHNATNSGWGTVVRRLMENLGSVFIFILALGIPLVLPGDFRDGLWEWITESEKLEKFEPSEEAIAGQVRDSQEAIEKAQAAVEAEKARASAGATAGEKRHFEDRIAGLEAKLKSAETLQLTEKEARKELKAEHYLHENTILFRKSGYLTVWKWVFRFIAYGIALGGIIFFLRSWSLKQDATGDPKYFRWMRRAACGFLPVFAASWTFLVIDWLMALDYTWFSTMWGVYLFAGSAQASMAFLIILLTLLRRSGYLKVVTMEHYHLMGKLLLAFTIFWAYIAFSQFFLIWYANITEETKFYLTRNTEYWNSYTIGFLVIGHFLLPFTVLLIQQWKKKPLIISSIGIWVLIMHFLDIYFIIIPERGPSLTGGQAMGIKGTFFFDLLAWIAVGSLFGYFLIRQLSNASLFPCRDPRLDESLNVTN